MKGYPMKKLIGLLLSLGLVTICTFTITTSKAQADLEWSQPGYFVYGTICGAPLPFFYARAYTNPGTCAKYPGSASGNWFNMSNQEIVMDCSYETYGYSTVTCCKYSDRTDCKQEQSKEAVCGQKWLQNIVCPSERPFAFDGKVVVGSNLFQCYVEIN
jgi:hypothetical protein